jgi:Flp pilus assembly protein TadD
MKTVLALLLCALLASCAAPRPTAGDPGLLHDELFAAPLPIDAQEVFALSDEMRAYAAAELSSLATAPDLRQALIAALYSRQQLRLLYDGGPTRTAAQAFEARAGNCLSLVIMTAAFARHLGLPVSYRSVTVDQTYSRSGGLVLASGHVNLVLGPPPRRAWIDNHDADSLTVDFLPQEELRGQVSRPLQEQTIVAMYMNNRAAEALSEGRTAEGYWWAREAVRQDPEFLAAANTLGVVYLRAGHAPEAEQALRHVLAWDPDHVSALTNLAGLLAGQGRDAEAQALNRRLAELQPEPPFRAYDLGRAAMRAGDYEAARAHFDRELKRQPYQEEVHYWAALVRWHLGDTVGAESHLRQARDFSASGRGRELYAAKLAWLRALHLQ